MKTITKIATIPARVIQSTVYIAEDGKLFDNQEDCQFYESYMLLQKIKTAKISAAPTYTIPTVWYYCKTEEELEALRFRSPSIRAGTRNFVLNKWIAVLVRDNGDYESAFIVSKEETIALLKDCLSDLEKLESEQAETEHDFLGYKFTVKQDGDSIYTRNTGGKCYNETITRRT